MFNIFGVALKKEKGRVEVSGINRYLFIKDVSDFANTSVLVKHMFKFKSRTTFVIREFFLLELHYVVVGLLNDRKTRTNRKSLKDLKELLETETWIKDTVNPKEYPLDTKFLKEFKLNPFDSQLQFLKQYATIVNNYNLKGLLLDGKAGSGKELSVNTKVRTPDGGFKRHGSLKEGDEILTRDGKVQTVEGVFPQGLKQLYTVTFEDGRTVESGLEHLWTVKSSVSNEWSVYTTEDLIQLLSESYPPDLYIPLSKPSRVSPPADCNDPYLGGVLIERYKEDDGHFLDVSKLNPPQAKQYLKGVFQTFAILDDEGAIRFKDSSLELVTQLQKMVWMLGGIAEINGYTKHALKDSTETIRESEETTIYCLKVRVEDPVSYFDDLFEVEYPEIIGLKITSIVKSNVGEAVCISVSSPDALYVVDDYIVTHNTLLSLMWSRSLNKEDKTIILCPSHLVNKVWVNHLDEQYKEPPKYWSSKMDTPVDYEAEYYVIHYDFLTSNPFKEFKAFMDDYRRKGKQFKLIVDECHNFNDPKALRTTTLIDLADQGYFSHALPGSGTPLKAASKESFTIFSLIDGLFDKLARDGFKDSYGRAKERLNELFLHRIGSSKFTIASIDGMDEAPETEYVKVSFPDADKFTLESLSEQMKRYLIQRGEFYRQNLPLFNERYRQVIGQYEKSIVNNKQAQLELERYKKIVHRFRTKGYSTFHDGQDSQFCKSVEKDIEKGLKGQELKEFRNICPAIKYLSLKLRGEALGNVLSKARAEVAQLMIEHAELPERINHVEKKTLIFTNYVPVLDQAENYLTSQGFKPVTVYGLNNSERDANVLKFEIDPTLNPLITTYKSLKEGYPLIMANQIIMIDSPFRDYEVIQTKARVHRKGQDVPCFFVALDLDTGNKPNIASRTIDILKWSKEQTDQLISSMEGHIMEDILGQVEGAEMLEISEEPDTEKLSKQEAMSLFG